MKLDNQLLFRESNTKLCRMCSTSDEVEHFVSGITNYNFSDIERLTLDYLLSELLPMRDFHLSEKRRFILCMTSGRTFVEVDWDGEVPEGCRKMGVVYMNAYSSYCGPVARLDFGDPDFPVVLNVSRKSSVDSLPISLAEDLWRQQLSFLSGEDVPRVMADLTPIDMSKITRPAVSCGIGYTANIEDLKFPIKGKDDFISLLRSLLGHEVSSDLYNLSRLLFDHLESFPAKKVSSCVFPLYTNRKKQVYVGGNGFTGSLKLSYIGKVFPQYFSGLPGSVFLLRIGYFEDLRINILVERN